MCSCLCKRGCVCVRLGWGEGGVTSARMKDVCVRWVPVVVIPDAVSGLQLARIRMQ